MLEAINIKNNQSMPLDVFLAANDFEVSKLSESVYQVKRFEELPVFLQIDGVSIYFEVDLGNISAYASQDLYFKCLDLNTEILPVSIGINATNADDPRLVLVESRETKNLDENELLSVFNALELATDKVENLLADHIK